MTSDDSRENPQSLPKLPIARDYMIDDPRENPRSLPEDILNKIESDFKGKAAGDYVKAKLLTLYTKNLNVGAEQLMRCVLAIANGDQNEVDNIFNSNFYNDPRDVLVEATVRDNSVNYGLSKFQKSAK
ncbi:MAG: hypothetical protein LBU73_08430 [Helicobacteraceae bacterium]|jgi:hypothetical protein|nr:hypothetical protein [Helicobacteraceae bacterium]